MMEEKNFEGQKISLEEEQKTLEKVSGGEFVKLRCRRCGMTVGGAEFRDNGGFCNKCVKIAQQENAI